MKEQYLFLVIFNLLIFFVLFKLSNNFDLTDKPNNRKIHKKPIPLIGGLVIYFSLIFSLYLFEYPEKINYIIVYSSIIVLTGFLDDFYDLKVPTRIIFIFFACYLLISENLVLNNIGEYNNVVINLGSFGMIFTILCVAGLTNAYNFLDGVDGLLLTQVLISHFLLLIFSFFFTNDFFILNYFVVIFILCILGIIYNFGILRNFKIFLGDSGSMFFGFSFGFILIYFANDEYLLQHKILVVWTVAFPVIDFISTVIKRIINKSSPFYPDMTHFHHLIYNFFNNRSIVLLITSSISLFLAFIGYLTLIFFGSLYSLMAFIILTIIFILISYSIEVKTNKTQ
jgi:UDP-GlcNAc:undecaprenyl-phosphate/decaprenyl-phosphate GlcNAc-1-phosphate transferase